jgi:hypothetical protein
MSKYCQCGSGRGIINTRLSVLALEQFGMDDHPRSFLGCA